MWSCTIEKNSMRRLHHIVCVMICCWSISSYAGSWLTKMKNTLKRDRSVAQTDILQKPLYLSHNDIMSKLDTIHSLSSEDRSDVASRLRTHTTPLQVVMEVHNWAMSKKDAAIHQYTYNARSSMHDIERDKWHVLQAVLPEENMLHTAIERGFVLPVQNIACHASR